MCALAQPKVILINDRSICCDRSQQAIPTVMQKHIYIIIYAYVVHYVQKAI